MNLFSLLLAFLEGIALIVSPCILPVLPIILAASITGGHKRPFGIILGFVVAFSAFAIFSRHLILWLQIDLDIIKYTSLVLLSIFGLVLLSEKLSDKFSFLTARLASKGDQLSSRAGEGFWSGIWIGVLIGLVWTPCAGPILAAVLVQVIREESSFQAFWLIASFATGVGVPMLLISLLGKRIIKRIAFLNTHTETIRKVFGVFILLSVAFIATGVDLQGLFEKKLSQTTVMNVGQSGLTNALTSPYPAPAIIGIADWLNSGPLTLSSLRGKVVLIDFWTYSCINCIRTLPYLTQWDELYRDKGLVIIGIHSPEFEFEKNKTNVAAAIEKYGIHYPVAMDSHLDTWVNFQNRFWPAHYLINQEGNVVYTYFGEGEYGQTENNIRFLLGLAEEKEMKEDPRTTVANQTPETYLGFGRSENWGSLEKIVPNVATEYTFPQDLPLNHWALEGNWRIEPQRTVAQSEGAAIRMHFFSQKVYLVLGSDDGRAVRIKLLLNGKPLSSHAGQDVQNGEINVDSHRLYELVSLPVPQEGVLSIVSEGPANLAAYAFTFGM